VSFFIEVGGIRKKGSGGSTGGHVEARMEVGGTSASVWQAMRPDPGSGSIVRLVGIRTGEGGG
jgi:hypothetical protein